MALSVVAYPEPVVAGERLVVLIVSGDDTVREKLRFVALPAESATWKETLVVPGWWALPKWFQWG